MAEISVCVVPPTNNHLDRDQRSRLLRSTRKLEAVLGTTPFLLEPEAQGVNKVAPRRPARREGQFFHSPNSSVSSLDSTAEYVLVKKNVRSAPYQVQAISHSSSSRSSSRSASPTSNYRDVKKNDISAAPLSVALDIPGSQTRSRTTSGAAKKGKGRPQALAQPLLLRLRSVPVPSADGRIKPSATNGPKETSSQPLSPVASSFNISAMDAKSPTSPTFSTALTDRQKRKKMAKLARTLGENIPPELVFGQPTLVQPPKRRTSLSISRPRAIDIFSQHKSSKSVATAPPPSLAVAQAPTPVSKPVEEEQQTAVPLSTPAKKRNRPRSLTLGSSAIASANATLAAQATRGTTSLDVQPVAARVYREQPFAGVDRPQPAGGLERGTRRKEKEWSGEWNLNNMDDVTKALRCLKGR